MRHTVTNEVYRRNLREDFKDSSAPDGITTDDTFSTGLGAGAVFILDITLGDGTTERYFGRADRTLTEDGKPAATFFDQEATPYKTRPPDIIGRAGWCVYLTEST